MSFRCSSLYFILCFCSAAKLDRDRTVTSYQESDAAREMAQAIADIKFTYVVSCQVYGMQKISKDVKDKSCFLNILNLMIMYRS
jgi:callose synthase